MGYMAFFCCQQQRLGRCREMYTLSQFGNLISITVRSSRSKHLICSQLALQWSCHGWLRCIQMLKWSWWSLKTEARRARRKLIMGDSGIALVPDGWAVCTWTCLFLMLALLLIYLRDAADTNIATLHILGILHLS